MSEITADPHEDEPEVAGLPVVKLDDPQNLGVPTDYAPWLASAPGRPLVLAHQDVTVVAFSESTDGRQFQSISHTPEDGPECHSPVSLALSPADRAWGDYAAWRTPGAGDSPFMVIARLGEKYAVEEWRYLGQTYTHSSPAVGFAGNGDLVLVSRSVWNRHMRLVTVDRDLGWTGELLTTQTTLVSPTLNRVGDRLFLGWAGTDGHPNLAEVLTRPLRLATPLVLRNQKTAAAPVYAGTSAGVVLAFRGNDARLNLITSPSSPSANQFLVPETSAVGPTLCAYEDRLFLGWRGRDRFTCINVGRVPNSIWP